MPAEVPSATAPTSPVATESVERPDVQQGCLARGPLEAPAWLFYWVAAVVAAASLAYLAAAWSGRNRGPNVTPISSPPGPTPAVRPAVPPRSRVALRRVLFAMLLAVVVYGGFAVWQGLGKMEGELGRFAWWSFAAACALASGNYLLRWCKWEFYLARLNIQGVGPLDSLLTFLSGFVLTVTPGKVGEVFKSLVLFETHGVSVERTAPIVVAERLTDVIGVVVLIVAGSIGFRGGLLWAGLGAVAVALALAVVASKRVSHGIIRLLERLPGPFAGLGPKLHVAYDSLAMMVKPSNLIVPTLLSIGAWALECAALWVILRGFGQRTEFGLAMFFYATSTLAGALVPVPGGLGVTETSLKWQMHELGHVAPATSTAAMILVRFATLWLAVLVGFLSVSWLKRRHAGLLA
jgi:glycosyltransferase 2 family protein